MESQSSKNLKEGTIQETFRKLRENDRNEMYEKKKKVEEAQERAKAAIAKKKRKRGKDGKKERPPEIAAETKKDLREVKNLAVLPDIEPIPRPPTPMTTKLVKAIQSKQRRRKKRGKCANCCGGLPGQGPGLSVDDRCGGHCSCSPEIRMRGGSDTDRSMNEDPPKSFRMRSLSENSRVLRTPVNHCCGHSPKMSIFEDGDETRFACGQDPQFCEMPIREERVRGGCGSCGGSPQSAFGRKQIQGSPPRNHPTPPAHPTCHQQMGFPCDQTSKPGESRNSQESGGGGCPCGGCGGPACSDNPGGGGSSGGCCGGNRPQGKPCKCKCQSCDAFRPLGGCGGQSCGRMYSCAGSSGGRCCFPRNTKRRSGPDCCGGGDPNCGGCC